MSYGHEPPDDIRRAEERVAGMVATWRGSETAQDRWSLAEFTGMTVDEMARWAQTGEVSDRLARLVRRESDA